MINFKNHLLLSLNKGMKSATLVALFLTSSLSMNAAQKIDRIEPTNWFVGMKNPQVQLMVYGKDVRAAEVSTDYPGVRIDSLVRLDSPNYLLVYMNVKDAKPGTMNLLFRAGKSKTNVKYELKARDMKGEDHMGFTNADVLYMLMPDRFASSGKNLKVKGLNAYTVNRKEPSLRHGGDLEGIRQHLDYFNELGVTALWFTPVLENNSPDHGKSSTYHGYATTDYYRVDPRFGSNNDYRQLVSDAHKKGLKVVMDMIFNHCGFEHPWVKDMPTKDWFNTPEWLAPENQAKAVKTKTVDGDQMTKLQADAGARPVCVEGRPARDGGRLVRALNARPQPAQRARDDLSHTELGMVDRDRWHRRHTHGHLSVRRPQGYGALDGGAEHGVSQLQHGWRDMGDGAGIHSGMAEGLAAG